MSATFGTTATIPSGATGTISEYSSETSVEIKTIIGTNGNIAQAAPLKMKTTKLSIKGKGTASLSAVAAGAITGTAYLISATQDETNDDFPEFSLEFVSYA